MINKFYFSVASFVCSNIRVEWAGVVAHAEQQFASFLSITGAVTHTHAHTPDGVVCTYGNQAK